MPHISKHAPTQDISRKIFERLIEAAAEKGSAEDRRRFFVDLLTPTERIMLSKRFAIIYMLAKGYSFDAIQESLRVSPSTIARVWTDIQRGKLSGIVKRVKLRSKDSDILLEWLSSFARPMHMSKKQYVARMQKLGL